MKSFRVATYNIHKCQGMDGRVKPERIARVLEEVNADVIGLQEVLSICGHREDLDQARFIAETLRMHYAQVETRKLHGGCYGNTILSRFPLDAHTNHDLTHGAREARTVQRADIAVNGRKLHVLNLHLGTGFFERRHQARALVEREVLRAADMDGERLVIGDLNEWTRGLITRTLTNELRRVDLEVPFLKRRYPALLPFLQLDYIYFEHTIRLRDAFFHTSRLALIASDHLPLVADFEI